MTALRARLILATSLWVACDSGANDAARDAERAVGDASSDAEEDEGPAQAADAGQSADGRVDMMDGSRASDGARPEDTARDGASSVDGASPREGGAGDATLDSMMPYQPFTPPTSMPWAGQCAPGLNGTVQMRPACESPQIAAIQAAGVGPAKAFTFAIYSYALDTPMQAGKPFTFSITAFGSVERPLHMEFWGAQGECGATNIEKLAGMLTPGGIVCATMTPSAAHSHLLLVTRSNGNGHNLNVHSECPGGACVMNTGTTQDWPDKDKPFCNPRALAACEVCSADEACSAPAYNDRGDGTVSSSCCGLTWQKTADAPSMSWGDAVSYCAGLSMAGGGFRLPTFAELHALVKAGSAPSIDQSAFPATRSIPYWTASESIVLPRDEAWSVNFDTGMPYEAKKYDRFGVRCVR